MKEIPAGDGRVPAHFRRQRNLILRLCLDRFPPSLCVVLSPTMLCIHRFDGITMSHFDSPPKSHPYRVLFPVNSVPADGTKTFRQNFKGTQTFFPP